MDDNTSKRPRAALSLHQQRVFDYIKQFGSITPLDAYKDLGMMRLASAVFGLRQKGLNICTTIEYGENRFQEQTKFARYTIITSNADAGDPFREVMRP